jgi:hypothetical protein
MSLMYPFIAKDSPKDLVPQKHGGEKQRGFQN